MPGPWITDTDLKDAVARMLKKGADGTALNSPYWDGIITESLDAGYSDLKNILVGKGFTLEQLDSWDDRVRYNKDQSLFWVMVKGAGLANYSDRDYNKLDHRKELEALATIMIGGVSTAPGGLDAAGGLMGGNLTLSTDGVDYATVFGLRVNRNNGRNQYGDPYLDRSDNVPQ